MGLEPLSGISSVRHDDEGVHYTTDTRWKESRQKEDTGSLNESIRPIGIKGKSK